MAQILIGNDLYLFRGENRTSSDEVHLLISAHGGAVYKQFSVPSGINLHFYTKHGDSIFDPGVYNIMKGDFQPVESIGSGGTCEDYWLSKYQGSHGNPEETYDSIQRNIKQNAQCLSNRGRNFAYHFDVLTVRNRWNNFSGVKLSTVLELLAQNYHNYREVHCSFCRDAKGGTTVAGTKFGTGH